MKFVTIIGARPQFIKAAALSRVLRLQKGVKEILVHTGQHFDENMSKVFFEQMDIPEPEYNLEIAGLSHGAMTGRMLEKIEDVLFIEKPDRVLVYGDTNSTLAGALAASKLHIPIAHVEAGLRSFNMQMPEEINRILTDRLSEKLYCPTDTAVENLRAEGFAYFSESHIVKSGDVMQDAALFYAAQKQHPQNLHIQLSLENPFALVTLHRAENTDSPEKLESIFAALLEISLDLPILMPLHPRTKGKMVSMGVDPGSHKYNNDRFSFIDPVGYLEMVFLLQCCSLVMTDSGGLQKESFFFRKPCVTLREQTEWIELVDSGYNILVGSDKDKIITGYNHMCDVEIRDDQDLYGGGKAADNIVADLLS